MTELAGLAPSGAGWERAFLQQLGLLHLLVRGVAQRDTLTVDTLDLLLNAIGVPRQQEEVLALPPVVDRWQIVAQEVSLEDKLRVQKTRLTGERTGELATVLTFAHGLQPLDATLSSGFALDGGAPALDIDIVSKKQDGELLKGLAKIKTAATWVPWTFDRLTFASGYEAVRLAESLAAMRGRPLADLSDIADASLPLALPAASPSGEL